MAGSASNPGQTVPRARSRYVYSSFARGVALVQSNPHSPVFSSWRMRSYLMTRLSPKLHRLGSIRQNDIITPVDQVV